MPLLDNSDLDDDPSDDNLPYTSRIPPLFPSPISPCTPRHTRASSTPLLPSSGPIPSDPIIGDKESRLKIKRQKSQQARAKTLALRKEDTLSRERLTEAHAAEEQELAADQEVVRKRMVFISVLETLTANHLTFGELMSFVFNPVYKQGHQRWNGFFKKPRTASSILGFWVSKKNSKSAWQEVHDWAIDYVAHEVRSEARTITQSGWLQSRGKPLSAQYFFDFDLKKIYERLREVAQMATQIFEVFSTPAKHMKVCSPARQAKRLNVSPLYSLVSWIH